jgi:cytochrome c biogenesis protein
MNPLRYVADFLTSTRVGIAVMVILTGLSLAGAIIPQGGAHEAYIEYYGSFRGRLLIGLGLDDIFGADYYTGLLVLLCIMVFACALKRLPARLRLSRRKEFILDRSRLAGMPEQAELVVDVDPEEAGLHIIDICKRRLYSVSVTPREEGQALFASRMGFSRLGSFVLHLSFIFLLVGGIVGTRFGTRHYEDTRVGESFELGGSRGELVSVSIEDFTVELDEKERISDYICDVTVRSGRDVPFLYSIRPNHPLEIGRHEVYLVSYRDDPEVPEGFVVAVYDSTGALLIPHVYAGVDDPSYVGILGATVQASIGILPSVRLITDEGAVETYVIRKGLRDQVVGERAYRFVLVHTVPSVVVTLEVVKEPGQGFIIAGLLLLTVGSFVALYLSHRRLWFIVDRLPGDKARITFGGRANRNREGFSRDFEQMRCMLEELA